MRDRQTGESRGFGFVVSCHARAPQQQRCRAHICLCLAARSCCCLKACPLHSLQHMGKVRSSCRNKNTAPLPVGL